MLKLTLATLIALAGLAFATPTIIDDGFDYTKSSSGSYYTLAVVDGEVVVTLSHERSPDAIVHSYPSISRTTMTEIERQYARELSSELKSDLGADRSVIRNLHRGLAGMEDLDSGWQITHDKLNLEAAIAAYTKWFSKAGLAVTPDTRNTVAGVRPFIVSGQALAQDLRIVFARRGTAVRVYFDSL